MLRHTRRPCKTVPSLSPNRSPTMPSPEPPSSNDHFRPVTYPPGLFCYPSSRFGPPHVLSPEGRGEEAEFQGGVRSRSPRLQRLPVLAQHAAARLLAQVAPDG